MNPQPNPLYQIHQTQAARRGCSPLSYADFCTRLPETYDTDLTGLLDVPPQRLNAKDTPVPYHPNLWAAHRPTARSIAAAARKLLRQ